LTITTENRGQNRLKNFRMESVEGFWALSSCISLFQCLRLRYEYVLMPSGSSLVFVVTQTVQRAQTTLTPLAKARKLD
jgi:hypothetical protein